MDLCEYQKVIIVWSSLLTNLSHVVTHCMTTLLNIDLVQHVFLRRISTDLRLTLREAQLAKVALRHQCPQSSIQQVEVPRLQHLYRHMVVRHYGVETLIPPSLILQGLGLTTLSACVLGLMSKNHGFLPVPMKVASRQKWYISMLMRLASGATKIWH